MGSFFRQRVPAHVAVEHVSQYCKDAAPVALDKFLAHADSPPSKDNASFGLRRQNGFYKNWAGLIFQLGSLSKNRDVSKLSALCGHQICVYHGNLPKIYQNIKCYPSDAEI